MARTVEDFRASHTRLDPETGCINWVGTIRKDNGYGQTKFNGRFILAHRLFYEDAHGPIPKDLVIDHLCRNRACVNTAHMELVSPVENVMRGIGFTAINAKKTVCSTCGGPLHRDEWQRRCRNCAKVRAAQYREKRREGRIIRMGRRPKADAVNAAEVLKLRGLMSVRDIAARFDVTESTIYRIYKGSWR